MSALHMKVRQQVKKNQSGLAYSSSTRSEEYLAVLSPKGFVITNAPMASNDILPSIPWVAVFTALQVCPIKA